MENTILYAILTHPINRKFLEIPSFLFTVLLNIDERMVILKQFIHINHLN